MEKAINRRERGRDSHAFLLPPEEREKGDIKLPLDEIRTVIKHDG